MMHGVGAHEPAQVPAQKHKYLKSPRDTPTIEHLILRSATLLQHN
jgi:hypothetical protein